jgi:hypothetical protein
VEPVANPQNARHGLIRDMANFVAIVFHLETLAEFAAREHNRVVLFMDERNGRRHYYEALACRALEERSVSVIGESVMMAAQFTLHQYNAAHILNDRRNIFRDRPDGDQEYVALPKTFHNRVLLQVS